MKFCCVHRQSWKECQDVVRGRNGDGIPLWLCAACQPEGNVGKLDSENNYIGAVGGTSDEKDSDQKSRR